MHIFLFIDQKKIEYSRRGDVKVQFPESDSASVKIGCGVIFPIENRSYPGHLPQIFFTYNGVLIGILLPFIILKLVYLGKIVRLNMSDNELYPEISLKRNDVKTFKPNFGNEQFSYNVEETIYNYYDDHEWIELPD